IVEARNMADNVIYQVEKALKENGERVPSDLRYEAESKINDLRQIMNGEDDRRMRSLSEELQQLYGRILQAAAPQAAGTASGNGHHGQTSPEGDVVEGEFKEA
ncbi:MAG: Hsp70 family protein, partial [Bellilinea sp.]